jgi:hypothetical protein
LLVANPNKTLDPVRGSKQEAQAVELQAIGRAHRQGQTKQIYIVRFVVRNSIDHRVYLRNNNLPTDSCVEYDPETYRPSETTTQGRAATLTKSGSFSALTMEDLKRSQEIMNNTNEKEQPKKKKATKKKTVEKKNNNNEDEDIIQEDSE